MDGPQVGMCNWVFRVILPNNGCTGRCSSRTRSDGENGILVGHVNGFGGNDGSLAPKIFRRPKKKEVTLRMDGHGR
jgi:hypothetical protein